MQDKQMRDFRVFPCVIIGLTWSNSQLESNESFVGQLQSAGKDTWNIWGHIATKAAMGDSWDGVIQQQPFGKGTNFLLSLLLFKLRCYSSAMVFL